MAQTDISICSRALVTLGAEPISSFLASEGDTAVICANIYPGLKAGIMSRYQWRFLMKKKELSRDATAPIGEWAYSYVIPGDALGLPNALFSSSQQDVSESQFEVFGRRIYCDFERLLMDYTSDVSEANWPAYFVDLMVKCLCSEIAFAVTDQQGIAQEWSMKAYGTPGEGGVGGALGDAMSLDGQGNGQTGIVADVFANARHGGGGWF
tara:strand:- start:8302 stop:8928 length:627 start_codon:yes stop_codon:yes gene_type:complete